MSEPLLLPWIIEPPAGRTVCAGVCVCVMREHVRRIRQPVELVQKVPKAHLKKVPKPHESYMPCCNNRQVHAAASGHAKLVEALLSWPLHPARANCLNSMALVQAAWHGHEEVRMRTCVCMQCPIMACYMAVAQPA